MADPVLVELTRGGVVESFHHGAVAVVDAKGGVVLSLGDIDRPIFPRSAVKGFQALPLIESGAADRFGLTRSEIALACASHSGEARHAEGAAGVLAKAGKDLTCLECGAHWPSREKALRALAASGGEATALHNNCSGKHAGFICVAVQEGHDPRGYVKPEHPVMREITAALGDMAGFDLGKAARGVALRIRSATKAPPSSISPDPTQARIPACQATAAGSAAPAASAASFAGSMTRKTWAKSETVLMPYGSAQTSVRPVARASCIACQA